MRKTVWMCMGAVLLAACGERPRDTREDRYFSLSDFMDKEAARLSAGAYRLAKTASKDGLSEEKTEDRPDWHRELNAFVACDINHAAAGRAYRVDTVDGAGPAPRVVYKALGPKAKVQELDLRFHNGGITRITVLRRTDNSYFKTEKKLVYIPDSGYTISAYQKVLFGKPSRIAIRAAFLK